MSYQPAVVNTDDEYKVQAQPYILREDEKIPLFLIKLWNIVEDPSYYEIIRWDESGYSFHINDPYSFCRNVLPQYFKHNNLNSLIRQLNMYGFRKMTPIERSSLARAESDQDHLEFSHPYFVREHPELLVNIKRKIPVSKQGNETGAVSVPAKDLSAVFEELRQLRERQKSMEFKMNKITKENELLWQEIDRVSDAHMKQKQIVNKLVQFIAALVHTNKHQRLGKRHMLAIDEFQAKRAREGGINAPESAQSLVDEAIAPNNHSEHQQINANEVLDELMHELATEGAFNMMPGMMGRVGHHYINDGPIIADVTDELEQLKQVSDVTDSIRQQSIHQQKPPLPSNFSIPPSVIGRGTNTSAHQQQTTLQYSSYSGGSAGSIKIEPQHAQQHQSHPIVRRQSHYQPTVTLPPKGTRQGVAYPQYNIAHQSQQSSYQQQHQPQAHVFTVPRQQIGGQQQLPQISYKQSYHQQHRPQQSGGSQPQQIQQQQRRHSDQQQQQLQSSPIILQPLSNDSSGQPQQSPVAGSGGTPRMCSTPSASVTSPTTNTPQGGVPAADIDDYVHIIQQAPPSSTPPTITFEDSPRSFTNYLSSVDESINQCRDDIANHWDLDHLLEGVEDWQDLLNDEDVQLAQTAANEQTSDSGNGCSNLNTIIEQLSPTLNVPMETPTRPGGGGGGKSSSNSQGFEIEN